MIEELEDDNLSPEVMISLRDLRVSYGEREILHGVSFDVMRGETMVIRSLIAGPTGLPYFKSRRRSSGVIEIRLGSFARRTSFSDLRY